MNQTLSGLSEEYGTNENTNKSVQAQNQVQNNDQEVNIVCCCTSTYMNNPKLVSIRLMLVIFSGVGMIVGSQVSSVLAQGNTTNTTTSTPTSTPTSTVATFTAQGADYSSLKDTAKAAREGALRIIDWTVKGFLTENSTETANALYSDESANGTQSLKGLTAIKDMVSAKIDNIIGEEASSSSVSFNMTVGTQCKPSNTDCNFKINLQK